MDIIQQTLGTDYAMFYHPGKPITDILPILTYASAQKNINQWLKDLGRDLSKWNWGQQDQISQIMRANWICQRLPVEPIRKPLLVHKVDNKFQVDCGDTRLMALIAHNPLATTSLVVTCLKSQSKLYKDWTPVAGDKQLIELLNFSKNSSVLARSSDPRSDYAMSWLEIGDSTTAHHLHNMNERVNFMQEYLNQQPSDFEFNDQWVSCTIDWASYLKN